MNAYNLLYPHQRERYNQIQRQNRSKARWFMRACISGEVEDDEPEEIKKDPLDLALFLIEENGYTTVADLMDQSGFKLKKVSTTLLEMMETHGLKRFRSHEGEYRYYLDSSRVDTRSTEQKILDLITEKPRTRAELCIAVNRTKSPVIKILHKLIKEQKINRSRTGLSEYLYTIREAN